MIRQLNTFLCITLFLTGCTGALVKRGDNYAELQQWVLAVDAYARAHEVRPNAAEIETKLRQAREQAVTQEVARAQKALSSGALKVAWRHVAQAARVHPNEPRVKEVRKEIRDAVSARVTGAIEGHRWEEAFQLWEMLRRHDSGSPLVEVLTQKIAHAMISEGERLQSELRFWEARDVLLLLGTRQPSYAREVEIRVDELRKRWISGMRNQSLVDERANRLASALIRASVVAGLSNHRDDHQRRQRLKAMFLRRHGVVIGTQITGNYRRSRRFVDHLDRALSWRQVVRWKPGQRKAELGGTIHLLAPDFQDTFKMRTGSVSYVAGTEEVANPDYQKAKANIAVLARQLDQTNRMLASLEGERTLYEFEIAALREANPQLKESMHQFRDQQANASVQRSRDEEALRIVDEELSTLDAQQARWDELNEQMNQAMQELAMLTEEAVAGERETLEQNLLLLQTEQQSLIGLAQQRTILIQNRAEIVQRLEESRLQYQMASKELLEAEQRFATNDSRLATCLDEFSAVRQELNDMVLEFSGITREYNELISSFLMLSPTITREIQELYHYQIRDWTRTSTVSADMTEIAPPQPDMKQLLSVQTQTQDSANPSHRRYGVSADVLAYPKTDAELVNSADALLQNIMKDWLKQALSVVRANRLARAQRRYGKDNEGAAADYLVAWMLSSRHAPAGLDTFLEETYGKMDMNWLEVRGH